MAYGDKTARGRGDGRSAGQGQALGRARGGRTGGGQGGRNGGLDGGRDGGQGGRGGEAGRGGGGRGGGRYGGRGRGTDGGRGTYSTRGNGGLYRGALGPGGGGRGWAGRGRGPTPPQRPPPHTFGSIGDISCSRFIARLASCTPAGLAQAVVEMEPMWTASWRQAAALDGTSMRVLLAALARLPVSASVAPPRLHDVVAVVAAFLQYASDATNAFGAGLSIEENKLSAVEVVEKVIQRLTKFTWLEARDDVHNALNDMLTVADRLLEPRYATHRSARQRVMGLFSELDKPWVIRTNLLDDAIDDKSKDDATMTNISPWKQPTIAWLSDWNHFQPLKLPSMKVPGGHGDGVYESPDEYFDTTIKLWTGMTFIDGHNALLPHCTLKTNGKICDQPLWPMHARGYPDYECRTRGCLRLVEYVCANRTHHVGLCKSCALDRQQKLCGPPSERASTHIYDATVCTIRYDGKVFLSDFASRRPPGTPIHWKTTRRLSSPNLVGIVLLSSRRGSLKPSDKIYWAKVALHGQPRDEFKDREAGRLTLELLEYSVDETGNPLLAKDVEQGTSVAIIDCQTFVPEFIPVLKALERQREMPMPFQAGALVNLKRLRGQQDDGKTDDFMEAGGSSARLIDEGIEYADESDDDVARGIATQKRPLPALDKNAIRSLIDMLVEKSMLDPIVQIRRDTSAADRLRVGLTKLVTQATLDRGQLISFIDALRHPVHCTQGPPGTGKSYLGVVVVRALLMIRKLWMSVCPSVGEPPILVLSYKNHAIDEFLMDLVKAESSIQRGLVRLGGGCTEPTLFRFQESSVIASTAEVEELKRSLDDLHQLASKVRGFRNSFGVIYEAQVLVTDQSQEHGQSDDADVIRDRNNVLSQAANELAVVTATVLGISQLDEIKPKRDDADDVNDAEDAVKTEVGDKVTVVTAAREYLAKKATLRQEDVAALYSGIQHYDPQMDPAEILLRWICGFEPFQACAYEEEDCTDLADHSDSIFCKQHRCHFASISAGGEDQHICEYSVVPHRGFCRYHLCSTEDCRAPVFRDNQKLCARHACFVCIRDKTEYEEVLVAEDAPPRNTCSEHPLCWWATRDNQCENVVASLDSSYCPEHSKSTCQGKTPSGAPCTAITISRTTPFCYSHVQARGTSSASSTGAIALPGKCAATNAKGKPCKGTPIAGMMFCVNHVGRDVGRAKTSGAAPSGDVFMRQKISRAPTPEIRDGSNPIVGDDQKDTSDDVKAAAEGGAKPAEKVFLLEAARGGTTEHVDARDSDDSASGTSVADSDASGSFVAIDQVLPNAEEDFDEPDHIQHLRDVDEVEVGGNDEDEFIFGEDDMQDDGGYSHDVDDGFIEYATLSVGEWHWNMSLDDRWNAIRGVLSQWDPLSHSMIQAIRSKFELTKQQLQHERNRAKTKMYEGRAIIGGTITGCVTRLEAIRATKPFAILVEEASEVLEPLLFACLGSTTCKLEMIGDHLQLQPSVMSKFDFERVNKINISMFERLIRAPGEYEVPSSVLSLQRRMRKNIADLTREFYVDITMIEDHETCQTKTIQSVQTPQKIPFWQRQKGNGYAPPLSLPAVDKLNLSPARGREVPGVASHIFFWTHRGREEKSDVGLSRVNRYEADMACFLAKYLVDCGVPSKSIAILTPYKGQLMLMRNLLMSPQLGMKTFGRDQRPEPSCTLSTVDRFQGDEADIVIVSLVIDGKSRTPFVKLQNRMIVLLSRARIGMYVVGNIDYFTSAATSAPSHWQATLDKLQVPAPSDNAPDVDTVWPSFDQARLGGALPLCCPQHCDSVHSVQDPKQLKLSFCEVVCHHTLECSHECGKRCHWSALDQHTKSCEVQVDSPCVRHAKKLMCAHVCQKTSRRKIADALAVYRCDTLVDLQLPCTHFQRVACAQEADILERKMAWPKCTENAITPFVYPECKHEVVKCTCDAYYAYQGGSARPRNCSIDVEYVPSCGHASTLKCYARNGIVDGQNPYICRQKVRVVLPRCGHNVTTACPIASALRSWSGVSLTTFGVVEESVAYGPADHSCTELVAFRRQCGHETRVHCSAAFNMASTKPPCSDLVNFTNPECGHVYHTTCAEARRLQQRVDQATNVQPPISPVGIVKEEDRLLAFRNFGLNVPCKTNVTLRRTCGHEQDLPCHQARSTSQPCSETTDATRPDCGHALTLPCSLVSDLHAWQPWSQVSSEQRAAVDLVVLSSIVSMSLPTLQCPLSASLQSALGVCKLSVMLRRDTSCGHEGRFPCDQAMKILRGEVKAPLCNQLTTKLLRCGHTVEVLCYVDVAKYRCKKTVTMPCWNAAICHQTVDTQCGISAIKLQCQSRTVWTCASGKHKHQVSVCSKGEPTACPACSFDTLIEMTERVRRICDDELSEPVPWPPADIPAAALSLPAFGTATDLRERAKLEFYRRQLNVLERFRGWIEQDEDVWSRALFLPMYLPVFTVVNASKATVKSPVVRFELKDFASTATWNNIQAYPVVPENVSLMVPPTGGGKKTPPTRRVVFGVFFSVGINTAPSDAPTATKFGPKHSQWIETQQQKLGYDSAFFAKKKSGKLSQGGTVRVWDPYAMFPTGEASVQASQQKTIVASLGSNFAAAVKPLYDLPQARFLVFKPHEVLPTSTASAIKDEGPSDVNSLLSPEEKASCGQLFEALSLPWARRIRLFYPWTGSPLLVGSTSLPESVDRQMYDKLAFLRAQSGAKEKGKRSGPFVGINYLKSVTAKQPFEEADLFTALELLDVQKTATKDPLAMLGRYVDHVRQCHPLLLVALARLVARNPGISPRVQPVECLTLFQTLYPDAAKLWLTAAEREVVTDRVAGGKVTQSTKTKDESTMSVEEQWQKLKTDRNCASKAMDELLKMVGLAKVKRFAINMFKRALALQRLTPSQRKKNANVMNYCFVGNPGTGKTTVAKLFARILNDSGMRRSRQAVECNAQKLKDEGVDKFRASISSAMGGVVFVDEAYELEPSTDPKGKPIVAEILVAAEEYRHDLSMILAGYEDDIKQKLYAHNDGFHSRFTEVEFDDFDEPDLRVIWDGLLADREWNCDPKVSTIACRRLARGAGRKGFGNARAVRQLVDHATVEAMAREDFDGVLELRAVDVIGERPSKNPELDLLVQKLHSNIGWKRIKECVHELIGICDANYERELNGHETLSVVMNRLFLGNPGTGKTTCASLYGKLLKHLGFLSNGEVVKKTAGDFVGQYIGQSQTKTNDILKLAKGKVLIIDEAYNLNDNSYGKQALDVLVEKVQGTDTDDIAVILIGYTHQMTEMLRTQNPGLARRFPVEYAFFFDDYDDHELYDIFVAGCERKRVDCPLDVAEEAVKILSMQRRQVNFGNAGAVELLLKNAMANASKRPVRAGDTRMELQLEDIENEMSKRANEEDPLLVLDKLYRMDSIKDELQRLRTTIEVAKKEGEECPEIGHFVFRGSPGTGKTTVARAMGKILHAMGLLGSDRVVETSGLNMTGEFVGQTKKKVEDQLGQARGAILFIDEAYELGKGRFGEEAMTTLVAAMTNSMYDGMVIIIAGYPADMDAMLDRNAGLKSRFTHFLEFTDWETSDCLAFLQSRSASEKYALTDETIDELEALFTIMRALRGFGNGRDVDKVWKSMLECRAQRVVGQPELERTITLADVEAASRRVLVAREPPTADCLSRPEMQGYESLQLDSQTDDSPQFEEVPDSTMDQAHTQTGDSAEEVMVEVVKDEENATPEDEVDRDPGVSDVVWEELARAKEAYHQMLQAMKDADDRKKQDDTRRKLVAYKQTQEKLRRLGKCPMGFEWRQVGGGWRCAGGSHFVSNETLE